MPIDPSIVSALAPQAGATSTLAGQASMMNAYEAQRKAQEERRKEQEIRSILSSATDPVMGADLLTKRGYLDEAGKVLEQHDKHRKSLADLLDSDNKRDLFELDVLGRAVRDVKDQNSLEYAKKIAAAFGADGQKIGALLPETYDPAMTPAQVSALMDANLSAVEASNKTAKAIEALRDGKWRTGLAEALSVADSPDDWKNARETFRQAGMPQSELAQFPEEFSPENKVIAGNKALSEKDRRDLASKDAAAQAAAANTAADNARADAAAKRAEANEQARLALDRARLGLEQRRVGLAEKEAAAGGTGGAKLSAAAIEKVAGIEQSLGILNDLETLKKDEWLGPATGRYTEFKINLPGADVPNDLAKFAAQTATLKNAVVKAVTGAAMSEPEAKRIMAQVPNFTDKPNVWKQKLDATRENLSLLRRRTIELSGGTVNDTPAKSTAKDPMGIR